MKERALRDLLRRYRAGRVPLDHVMDELRALPVEDLGFAMLDTHREVRCGFPEVIFGPGKTAAQILEICSSIHRKGQPVLVTRTTAAAFRRIRARFKNARFHEACGAVTLVKSVPAIQGKGTILVISAGTSDIPVAEEAAVTADIMGNRVERLFDVGVAGIHRLLRNQASLRSARVIIVAAGMEGALPSVVGGLVSVPVIAVPTSIGYGASFKGVAALLGMLNSCASGVCVVNIDNGFGAAYAASLINRL